MLSSTAKYVIAAVVLILLIFVGYEAWKKFGDKPKSGFAGAPCPCTGKFPCECDPMCACHQAGCSPAGPDM